MGIDQRRKLFCGEGLIEATERKLGAFSTRSRKSKHKADRGIYTSIDWESTYKGGTILVENFINGIRTM